MAQNVFEALSSRSTLLDKMSRNKSVADSVMGYLNVFMGMSMTEGYPVDGVRIGDIVHVGNNVFNARVTMSRLSSHMPSAPFGTSAGFSSGFFRYVKSKANYMARGLALNHGFEKFFESMVTVIDNWAVFRGVRYEDVQVVDPIVTRDHIIRFSLRKGERHDIG